jgi:WD40 repeat protein
VTQQISALDAERIRKSKQGAANGPNKMPWRGIAIAGAAIVAVIALGYAGIKLLPHGGTSTVQAPANTPAGEQPSGTSEAPNAAAAGAPVVLHTEAAVYSLAYSPDGRIFASAGTDNNITLWDSATNQKLGEPLSGHGSTVHTVAFSPDGKTLASGSYDNSIILWDVASHKTIGQPLQGHTDSVFSLAFSPDGKGLVSGSRDKTIIAWNLATQKALAKVHTGPVESLAFSPDNNMLASGDDDDNVTLWTGGSGTQPPTGTILSGHTDSVFAVAFSPDGKTLASGSNDDSIILWDVASRRPIGEPLRGHADSVTSVAFSPDGKTLASGSQDKTVMLWDVATQKPIGKPLTGYEQPVHTVAFSPDGKTLATGSDDNFLILWDVAGLHGTSATTQQSPAQALNETPAAGTSSGENTSGLAAAQATAPTPTRLPATWYLTSLKAQVISLKFFEMGSDAPPVSERLYKDRFKASETRFIAYQLNLTFPPPGQKVIFRIRATYTNIGTGNVIADFGADRFVLSDWTNSYHDSNWGRKDYGWWQTGTYGVDLYVGGDRIASGTFEVY